MGRPPIFSRPLTSSERQKRKREKARFGRARTQPDLVENEENIATQIREVFLDNPPVVQIRAVLGDDGEYTVLIETWDDPPSDDWVGRAAIDPKKEDQLFAWLRDSE